MITAYDRDWSLKHPIEQHALERARVLLPPSDTCIYLGFPWSSLFTALQEQDSRAESLLSELKKLIPKNKPAQRVVTVCQHDNLVEHISYLKDAGVTDVFWSANAAFDTPTDIRVHAFPNNEVRKSLTEQKRKLFGTDELLADITTLFVDNTQYEPGTALPQQLAQLERYAPGPQKQQLSYLTSLVTKSIERSTKPQSTIKPKVVLLGEHSHRTPLSYKAYQYPLSQYVTFVESVQQADIIISGRPSDFVKNLKTIENWQQEKPGGQLFVVSEEPFWDMVWDNDFQQQVSQTSVEGVTLSLSRLNHVTSDVFNWHNLPYYITTDNEFFARYAVLFNRNANYTAKDWLKHWENCQYPLGFVAEKRQGDRYDIVTPQLDMTNDMSFRTKLAERFLGKAYIEGKGWDPTVKTVRQQLPDWHLDKLTKLDRAVMLMSALENTHHRDYITEKLFDAYAMGSIPLYSANPESHSVWRLVPKESLINLYGASVEQSENEIAAFTPTLEFAEYYVKAQRQLAELFSQPWLLWQERQRVAGQIAKEIYGN